MNKEIEADGFITPDREIKYFYNNTYMRKSSNTIVEAVQWNGDNLDNIARFCGDDILIDIIFGMRNCEPDIYKLTLTTPHGQRCICRNDYIIKTEDGEFIPCNSMAFNLFFERI